MRESARMHGGKIIPRVLIEIEDRSFPGAAFSVSAAGRHGGVRAANRDFGSSFFSHGAPLTASACASRPRPGHRGYNWR